MPAIRILPEALVNRIAAGEVIERPAAAVKELIENALDAEATRIVVVLVAGGIDRIEVSDDGCGMTTEELALSVQRHATSKLNDESLVRIATLGFRGEALPSIGAAARLAIASRPHGAPHAWAIRVEGSQVSEVMPAPGPPGTRVVVSELFYATPARRKFLKSPHTEAEHAHAAVRRLALAAPGVAFRLESDGVLLLDLPAQNRIDRAAGLLGPEAAAALLPVGGERGSLMLSGFAGSPSVTRATTAGQMLAVNGRPVADPVLHIAVRVAYRDVIASGRHPIVALWLDLPSAEVDVNVHPTKAELRFHDPDAVRGLIIGALRVTLSGGAGHAARPLNRGMRPSLALRPLPTSQPAGFAEAALPLATPPALRPAAAPNPDPAHPLGAAIAQVLDTYVIAVTVDGALVLVDQHAAHERLTHEILRAQRVAGGVRAQPLLTPTVVDLPQAAAFRLADAAPMLARLGLELESFGPGAVLVRALPAALGTIDPVPLLRDLADELEEMGEAVALSARLDAVLARMACHGSIRAGRRLTQPEMDALLRQMETTPRAATCSHGRPTFLRFTRVEIERMFGRR